MKAPIAQSGALPGKVQGSSMIEPIAQSGTLPGKAQDYTIGTFIGLNGQKRI
jgi:hypothetical protein